MANKLPPGVREELAALKRIAVNLTHVSDAGKRWLRDFLTAYLNEADEPRRQAPRIERSTKRRMCLGCD